MGKLCPAGTPDFGTMPWVAENYPFNFSMLRFGTSVAK